MLNNISWASYANALSILLFIYYGFVLIIYYRNDLINHLKKINGGLNSSPLSYSQNESDNVEIITGESDEEMNASNNELLLNIQLTIKNCAARNLIREEILLALKLQLQQKEAAYEPIGKKEINNFIKAQFENYCSIHLSEEEINVLWLK